VAAAGADDPQGRAALEDLCAAYWYPLYAFARRAGSTADDAADLTQGFFARLIEKDWVDQADRERGKFRTFLLAAFRHYTSNQQARAGAKMRGGDKRVFSLDVGEAESRVRLEPATGLTAEQIYARRYALTLIDRAWERLAVRYRKGRPERAHRFDVLRPCLEGDGAPPYRELGERLGLSETAVKVAVHRLRGHFREALRNEVADTLEQGADVDAEIRDLMAALA
jgi:RNA polymerase sigma factor (sigma-70 family)